MCTDNIMPVSPSEFLQIFPDERVLAVVDALKKNGFEVRLGEPFGVDGLFNVNCSIGFNNGSKLRGRFTVNMESFSFNVMPEEISFKPVAIEEVQFSRSLVDSDIEKVIEEFCVWIRCKCFTK